MHLGTDVRWLAPLLVLASTGAGVLGALTGLGGGVIIVPLLTLGFGVDVHYAIGASLISVIATSSGAAAAYVREGYTNIRVAMLLEVATTFGAVAGARLASHVKTSAIAVIFGVVLASSAVASLMKGKDHPAARSDRLATRLRLDGTFPAEGGRAAYHVARVPLGFGLMFVAGGLSGLLGIGSGAMKVLAMDVVMRLPFKVATTTSNFMIGVTAAAGAGIYLSRGYIDPLLACPVMLGVLAGAVIGARLLGAASVRPLRALFAMVIFALAGEMIFEGIAGRI
jgi:uncharacterized membrane protein YfcA